MVTAKGLIESLKQTMNTEFLYPRSLCHACRGCTTVITAKGSLFLRCDLRPEKYVSQPVLLCAEMQPWAILSAVTTAVVIAWYGPNTLELVLSRGSSVYFNSSLVPVGRFTPNPGPYLAITSQGLRLVKTRQKDHVAGLVLAGYDHLESMKAGEQITLIHRTPNQIALSKGT